MNNNEIYHLFMIMFFNPKKVEKNESFEDNVYGQAHEEFMENVSILEKKIPSLTEDDTESEKWYDEFHDEIVEEYCKKIIEKS